MANSNHRPAKILHITSYPPPRAGWGMRVYFLKQEMEKNGDICQVLNIGKGRFLTGRDFIPVLSGLDYVKKVIKHRLNGFTIHHHMNGDSPKGFVLALLSTTISLLTFKRPVLTFHAGPVQLYFPKFKAPLLTPVYWYLFHAAKYIVCNNEAVKKNIMSYGIRSNKIFPIPAFSRQYLRFQNVELPERMEAIFRERNPVIFCYVCFRPEFFIDSMIRAYAEFRKKYPKSFLLIVGNDIGKEPTEEQIKELGLEEDVYIAGDLDHDMFLTALTRSTLYLRTPVKDGVSSSVLESLSLNIPVVASENGSRPEGTITYENENIEDMVDKLTYVVENLEEVKKKLKKPFIKDTVIEEIELVKGA